MDLSQTVGGTQRPTELGEVQSVSEAHGTLVHGSGLGNLRVP